MDILYTQLKHSILINPLIFKNDEYDNNTRNLMDLLDIFLKCNNLLNTKS